MCGPMRGSDGRVEKVVCAGGYDGDYLKTIEVYDLKRNSWSTGKVYRVYIILLPKTPPSCNIGIEICSRRGVSCSF